MLLGKRYFLDTGIRRVQRAAGRSKARQDPVCVIVTSEYVEVT
jgi:hypothetical protein